MAEYGQHLYGVPITYNLIKLKIAKAARVLQISVIVPNRPIRVIIITIGSRRVVFRWEQFI